MTYIASQDELSTSLGLR